MKDKDNKVIRKFKIRSPRRIVSITHICPCCYAQSSKIEDMEDCCEDNTPFLERAYKYYGGE